MIKLLFPSFLFSILCGPQSLAQSSTQTLLVKAPEDQVAENLKSAFVRAEIVKSFPDIGWVVIRADNQESAAEIKAHLGRNKSIAQIEDNILWQQIAIPNDKKYSSQKNEIARTEIEGAWNFTTGSPDTLIAVIDSGIAASHPDLRNRLWNNPQETPNGIDDDRNGLVDDIYGWDFVDNDSTPEDESNHGTHVAGIIGAEGNNRIGIAGANWNCRIMALRTLDDRGSGSTDTAVEAILYAVSKGARVINASWGGYQHSQALQDALQHATDRGVLVVAAGGNNQLDTDQEPFYPAGYDVEGILAVASSESRGRLSSFSNFGRFSVDLIAPGSQIYSTVPQDGYDRKSGTSMAAPFVAGVAGLLLALDNSLSPRQLKNALMHATTRHSLFEGRVSSGGELNARAAVEQLNARFQIWPQRATLRVGGKIHLSSYAAPAPVVWSVSDPALAEVSPEGEVVGLAAGQVTITGTSGSTVQTSLISVGDFKGGGCGGGGPKAATVQASAPASFLLLALPLGFLVELRTRSSRRVRKILSRRNRRREADSSKQ